MLVNDQPMAIDFFVDVSCTKNGVDLLSALGGQSHVFREMTERQIAVEAGLKIASLQVNLSHRGEEIRPVFPHSLCSLEGR